MKYVLSTGKITNDVVTYIADLFYIEFNLFQNEVPNFNLGIFSVIDTVSEAEFLSRFTSLVSTSISKITGKFPSVSLKLESIQLQGNILNLIININNIPKQYEIQGANQ